MIFTLSEALDLFFRFGALGQLMLVLSLCLRRPLTARVLSLVPVVVCLAAYLLLTAPIPDADYGILRGWLLALTDALAYVIWFATLAFFRDGFAPRQWPWPVWLAIGLFGAWHGYFFVVLEGRGVAVTVGGVSTEPGCVGAGVVFPVTQLPSASATAWDTK